MALILFFVVLPVCLVVIVKRRRRRANILVPSLLVAYTLVSLAVGLYDLINSFALLAGLDAEMKTKLLAIGVSEMIKQTVVGIIVHVPIFAVAYFIDRKLTTRRAVAAAALLALGATAPALAAPPSPGHSLWTTTAQWRAIVIFAGEAPTVATALAQAQEFPELVAVDQHAIPVTALPASARAIVGIMRQPITGALPEARDEESGFGEAGWAAARKSKNSIILDVGGPARYAWSGVRKSSLLIGKIAALPGATAVWDVTNNEWFTPEKWRARRLRPEVLSEEPQVIAHALASTQPRANGHWDVETLGMEKFALPNLFLPDLDDNVELGQIVLLFVGQTLFDGKGQVGADGTLTIDLGRYRHWLSPALKPRPTRIRLIKRKDANADGGGESYEVVLIGAGRSVAEQRQSALQQLFGDEIVTQR